MSTDGRTPLGRRLAAIVGERGVLERASALLAYESDGLPGYRKRPRLAVFPRTRDEVVAVVRALAEEKAGFVPRGAGTGLSGGALAEDVVLLGLNRLNHVLHVDAADRLAVVEPGVVNVVLGRAVAPHGLHFAPDPSSQTACTIGGNVAENAGGPHCLKYGVTVNHVLASTVLLPSGEIVTLGGADGETPGYDLLGAFVGSEGCFGVALDVTVRLTPDPSAVRTLLADFLSMDAAARATSAIVAAGVLPAALELMDGATVRAVEASVYAAGYPRDAEGVLLVEVDGPPAGLDEDVATVAELCRLHGARDVKVASDPLDRARLWQGRKKAFGAMGRLAPHLVVQDAVVPRTRLAEVLATIAEIGRRHEVPVCNVFHAGDGNLHPNIPYDASDHAQTERVERAMAEIMSACIAAGGTITGEHGVGLDKLGYMEQLFDADTLDAMCRLRSVFDPEKRANPGKVVPMHTCREWSGTPAATGGRRPAAEAVVPLATPKAGPLSRSAAAETLAPLVRDAYERNASLRVVGGGTWMDAGAGVARHGEPLDVGRCSGIVSYVPGDLTLTALGGTSLEEIARATAEHGQWLALDPPGTDEGTIGATVATASAGALSHALGGPRDVVLGIEAVTGDGRVVRGGGRVVKNVAGFDLVRLMTGAWGTLGALTEITVRLRARPAVDATLAVAGVGDVAALVASFAERGLAPIACETISPALADGLRLGGRRELLLLRLAGNRSLVEAQKAAVARLGPSTEVDGEAWERLRRADDGMGFVVRLSARPSRFDAVWRRASEVAERMGGAAHGRPWRGIVRVALPVRDAADGELARGLVATHGGAVVIERLPELLRDHPLRPDADPLLERLARDVRHAFDPARLLNRGILDSDA